MDKKDKNKPQQIKIEIDETVGQGEYANFAIVTHSIAEFIVDFIKILPGLTKSKVKSRIVISPIHAKSFMKALSDNINKYEAKYGEIKSTNKNFIPEFKTPKDVLPN